MATFQPAIGPKKALGNPLIEGTIRAEQVASSRAALCEEALLGVLTTSRASQSLPQMT